LTIHGVTKEVNFPGIIDIKSNQIIARAKFSVRLEDYQIKIPQLVWQNIAEEVEVTVEFYYKPQ
jgi:polyisoprenoid-binding protein YceI